MLRALDLFSGIGGFSLGLERTGGFKTVAFCEIDPFCRKVLAKHWPDIPCYEDVRTLTGERLRADGVAVDAICGGFPCQDISEAGKGVGLSGERSGLWFEYARLIRELRPQFVIVENVAALLSRGLDTVLGNLAEIGFDAEWHGIPASALGAPHKRDRIWIVAYPNSSERWPHAASCGRVAGQIGLPQRQKGSGGFAVGGSDVPDSDCPRHKRQGCAWQGGWPIIARDRLSTNGQWQVEPELDRVVDGLPDWSHRIKALGNAVVPQIPELIGNAILASLKQAEAA